MTKLPSETAALLKHGCKLFPCKPDTKLPAITGWQDAATSDPDQVSEWIAQGYILGIYCAGSRFLGVDLDLKNDPQAWEWCHTWLSNAGLTAEALKQPLQFSRSGSPHFAFRVPDDWKPAEHGGLRTFKISDFRALMPGEKNLEIFSIRNRGLLIAAGSVVDGKRYTLPAVPTVHPWLPALGDALGHRSTIEAPTHDFEAGLKNCTFEEVDRAIDVLLPTGAFDVEEDWTQSIWRIKRSLGVAGWPLVEKISYSDGQDLRLVKWNNESASVADPYGAATIIKDAARVLKAAGLSDPIIFAAEQRYNGAVAKQNAADKMKGSAAHATAAGSPGMPVVPSSSIVPDQGQQLTTLQTQTLPTNVMPTPPKPLRVISAASFAGKTAPVREELVTGLIPAKIVGGLYADGGTGKSLLALMLGTAIVSGKLWLNHIVQHGPVVYVCAEDDEDEVHRRLADICRETGVDMAALRDFHILPLADEESVLAMADGRSSVLQATPLYRQIGELCADVKPKLLIGDTLSDIFAGAENDRMQAKQFVKLMRHLVIPHGGTGLVLAHPSVDGMRSGSGSAGSTGWNNSFRWRGYLERVLDEDGRETDQSRRVLRTKKANYGANGGEIEMRWQNGCFQGAGSEGVAMMDPLWQQKRADRCFLDLLRWHLKNNNPASLANKAGNYAPRLFKKEAAVQGVTFAELEAAMTRLLNSGQIENAPYGPPSKRAHALYTAPVNG